MYEKLKALQDEQVKINRLNKSANNYLYWISYEESPAETKLYLLSQMSLLFHTLIWGTLPGQNDCDSPWSPSSLNRTILVPVKLQYTGAYDTVRQVYRCVLIILSYDKKLQVTCLILHNLQMCVLIHLFLTRVVILYLYSFYTLLNQLYGRWTHPCWYLFPLESTLYFPVYGLLLLFLTWLYTRFWLYVLQKHPYCAKKHSQSLKTRPANPRGTTR